MDEKAVAIITAAGEGRRMGTGVSKQLLSLCGRTVLEYTVHAVLSAKLVTGAVLVVKPAELSFFEKWCREFFDDRQILKVVPGGSSRQESVYNGITALPDGTNIVAVHDGARPLISPGLIDRVIECTRYSGAATLGVPVKDTVKKTGDNMQVIETVSRENLWLVQTPQAFRYDVILDAHQKACEELKSYTDDAGLVEKLGYPVTMVMGSYENIKITTPEDVPVAEAFLRVNEKDGGSEERQA